MRFVLAFLLLLRPIPITLSLVAVKVKLLNLILRFLTGKHLIYNPLTTGCLLMERQQEAYTSRKLDGDLELTMSPPGQYHPGNTFTLYVNGKVIQRQELRVLWLLTSSPGRVLTKQEILKQTWGANGENSLHVAITQLRRRLGRERRQLITTYPRVGYKYAGSVTEDGTPIAAQAHVDQPSKRRSLPSDHISNTLPGTGPHLFGREKDLQCLNEAWKNPKTHIVVLVAFGGVGKTTLLNHWLQAMSETNYRGAQRVYARSFYQQGTDHRIPSPDVFVEDALSWFGDRDPKAGYPAEKAVRLAGILKAQRVLMVLDGLEVVQFPPGPQKGKLRDEGLRVLLRDLAASSPGLCVISTRLRVADLGDFENRTVRCIELDNLQAKLACNYLKPSVLKEGKRS